MKSLTADLDWKANQTPVSKRFGDVYYSADDGLAESRHVFLQGNNLPDDWLGRNLYCIGETGFGTGLNFLACWDLWRKTHTPGARLHYVSVEGFPLEANDLARALAPWAELADLREALLGFYPEPHPGFHRVHLSDDVTLTLLIGDAAGMLAELEAQIDAWFLDGFAPACNPEMWSTEVIQEIARLSRPGAKLATFTAAGGVRRDLSEVGFEVQKVSGFGRKRDMCIARYTGDHASSKSAPWYQTAAPYAGEKRAAILGGGVAGAATAHALAQRDWQVTLVERHERLAQEGSGNPSGIVMPRLSVDETADSLFYAEAYRYALQAIDSLGSLGVSYEACGVLQLPRDGREQRRFDTMVQRAILPSGQLREVAANEASEIAGVKIGSGALYLPQSGELQPDGFCAALVRNIDVALDDEIEAVERRGDLWTLLDSQGVARHEAPVVVLANGIEAAQMRPASWMPLQAFRGQISFVPQTQSSHTLKSIVSQGNYIMPPRNGFNALGATYDRTSTRQTRTRQSIRRSDHEKNIQGIEAMLPGLMTNVDLDRVLGRAALRCSTPDHHPVIGPVADEEFYREAYAGLRHGPQFSFPAAQYHNGLFSHVALGSRGLTTALLGAELLVSQMCGEPWPVERSIASALHPGRFLVRQLKRSQ